MPRLAASWRQAEVRAPPPSAHATPDYARHAPERTLLYALVEAHYPVFIARLDAEDRALPEYVREEFDEYLRCGVLEHGFLRVVCEHCRADKFAWSEFEQPKAGPKGGGQDARSKGWWRSPARSAASAPAAALGAWPRVRDIWWTRCSFLPKQGRP